jgi:hypothetical protein
MGVSRLSAWYIGMLSDERLISANATLAAYSSVSSSSSRPRRALRAGNDTRPCACVGTRAGAAWGGGVTRQREERRRRLMRWQRERSLHYGRQAARRSN